MSDDPFAINPLFSAWLDSQSRFLEAHAPFWSQISSTAEGDNDASTADEIWSSARKMGEAWLQTNFADGKGLAQQTLQRMLDPNQFLYAGSDEIGRTMQKLVEAPEFSDIGTLERQGLHATREWIALREASTEYRVVTGKAWTRAFERFSRELVDAPGKVQDGPNAIMRLWLDIANDELIATQRTNDFLSAQRKLLRAAVELRLRVRELGER